jgi:general secretion pathway protein G
MKSRGFTIVELLIVIVVIGVLAALVLNSFSEAQKKARVAQASNDVRSIEKSLAHYLANTGAYPCFDHTWDDAKERVWSTGYVAWPKNPWGSMYHWEHNYGASYAGSGTYSISIDRPGQENAQALDGVLDDNNLSTGKLRGNGLRLEYSGMDQSIPLNDCHI